ncbi:hypothetical protein I6N96_12555 [Enterococcus sp. BWM-S5]|uniref:Uncharacterized protein n=1 Tax=Enterococcus larvae TaxID=2794352 RepID=A0ABS4CKU0_9ENTE|nr:hypothetical protein [Enterococcus larvae]MBP1047104.1 hypothetical protein [Enterococcus larvae]
MSEEIEGLKNILSRYSLSHIHYGEKMLKEEQIVVPSFHFEEEGLSGFSFIADINAKTAYHATLSTNQRFIYIE